MNEFCKQKLFFKKVFLQYQFLKGFFLNDVFMYKFYLITWFFSINYYVRKDWYNILITLNSLTFADAVSQYGNKIDFSDLGFAYEKAAHNFEGQMWQNFVVLRDWEETETSGWGGRGEVLVELVEHHMETAVEEEIKELHGTDKRMNRMDPKSFKDVKCEKCSVKNDYYKWWK